MSRADTLAANDKKVQDLVLRGTPNQFDSTEALATTKYVQRAIGSYAGQVNYPGDVALTSDDIGKVINMGQRSTVTLPLSSSVPPGSIVTVYCSVTGPVTVQAKGDEGLISLGGGAGPFTINPGSYGVFRRLLLSTGWCLDSGDIALPYSPVMAGSNWKTQPQFLKDKSLATTEFVQRALGSFATSRGIGASAQLSIADVGVSVGLGGLTPYTVTLPDVADVPAGAAIGLHCRNAAGITVASKVDSQISPQGAFLKTITMSAGESGIFVREGSVWVVYGSAALKYSVQFAASLSPEGYQRLPSGIIRQWGSAISSGTGSGNWSATLPIAFPNACAGVFIQGNGGATVFSLLSKSTNAITATAMLSTTGVAAANLGGYYFAEGY